MLLLEWNIIHQCVKYGCNEKLHVRNKKQIVSSVYNCKVGWLCFTSHQQRGHLETEPTSSVFTLFLPGIEPRAVVWQSITLPLRRHASSTQLQGNLSVSWAKYVKGFAIAW